MNTAGEACGTPALFGLERPSLALGLFRQIHTTACSSIPRLIEGVRSTCEFPV
jgi:hypothetical protein